MNDNNNEYSLKEQNDINVQKQLDAFFIEFDINEPIKTNIMYFEEALSRVDLISMPIDLAIKKIREEEKTKLEEESNMIETIKKSIVVYQI
jgi:hypothetical protein